MFGIQNIEHRTPNIERKRASMNRTTFSFERFSLTPALSRLERENCPPMVGYIHGEQGRPFAPH